MPTLPYTFGKQQPYSEVMKMNVYPVSSFLDEYKLPREQRIKLIKSYLNSFLKERNKYENDGMKDYILHRINKQGC